MEKWAAMTKLDMGRRLTALKDSFNVTTIMFSKFHQVFVELFTGFEQDQSNMNRARRYRRGPTSVSDVYKLCWLLYISLKNRINTETVSCFHLLLCCLDFVYVSCAVAGRTDLFNQDFYQGESGEHTPSSHSGFLMLIGFLFYILPSIYLFIYRSIDLSLDVLEVFLYLQETKIALVPNGRPLLSEQLGKCEAAGVELKDIGILRSLCEKHKGELSEANVFRVYYLQQPVKELITMGTLKGSTEPLSLAIDFKDVEVTIKCE